tara:strand:+ start:132 stop:386 length:255 start_codon:yes stop_codon:yes gene_type:complete
MTYHDGIQFGHERRVRDDVLTQDLLLAYFDNRESVVRVASGAASTWEMFGATGDPLATLPAIKDACVINYILFGYAPATPIESI